MAGVHKRQTSGLVNGRCAQKADLRSSNAQVRARDASLSLGFTISLTKFMVIGLRSMFVRSRIFRWLPLGCS